MFSTLVSYISRQISGKTQILIYGTHSKDWMAALGQEAAVWKQLGRKKPVIVDVVETESLPPTASDCARTVVIPLLEKHADSLYPNMKAPYRTLVPDEDTLSILRDKAAFAQHILSNQLESTCPPVYFDSDSVIFPCVLKRTNLNASYGIAMVESRAHLEELLEQQMWKEEAWILQEFVPGRNESVVHCVFYQGRILWHCVYDYLLDVEEPIRRGIKTSSKSMLSKSELETLEGILGPLQFNGPCNVDFKRNDEGAMKIFEINPRLGGSLMQPNNLKDLTEALSCIISYAHVQTG